MVAVYVVHPHRRTGTVQQQCGVPVQGGDRRPGTRVGGDPLLHPGDRVRLTPYPPTRPCVGGVPAREGGVLGVHHQRAGGGLLRRPGGHRRRVTSQTQLRPLRSLDGLRVDPPGGDVVDLRFQVGQGRKVGGAFGFGQVQQ